MGNKDPRLARLWHEIDIILQNDWDPCNVNADGEYARDEYYGYIWGVLKLLDSKASKREIAKHLCNIKNEQMGMNTDYIKLIPIAEKLLKIDICKNDQLYQLERKFLLKKLIALKNRYLIFKKKCQNPIHINKTHFFI